MYGLALAQKVEQVVHQQRGQLFNLQRFASHATKCPWARDETPVPSLSLEEVLSEMGANEEMLVKSNAISVFS